MHIFDERGTRKGRTSRKPWPKDCKWPEPTIWSFNYDEDTIPMELDSEGEDFSDHINLLKLGFLSDVKALDPTMDIQARLGYHFINENLLRQAFTRRAFAIEYGLLHAYGLEGCSEELEFIGDAVISLVVTREISRQFTEVCVAQVEAPFGSKYKEGDMTKLREHFVCGAYLAERAVACGFDAYVLYGTGEPVSERSLADVMEAVIGAVAVDCHWDMAILERVVNELLYIQLNCQDELLKKSYYEMVNAWHQKHFGSLPQYEVHGRCGGERGRADHFSCDVRFKVPENDQGVWTSQRLVCDGKTRSEARELAAELAYRFLAEHGLWVNIAGAKMVPRFEDSINQLQELFQKKYLEERPEYSFESCGGNQWRAVCVCGPYKGSGFAESKVKAKKMAAMEVLERVLRMKRDLEYAAKMHGCSIHELYDPKREYPDEIEW